MVNTTALKSAVQGTQNPVKSNKMNLKTEDFINLMITQLQQQDPTDPAKSDQLLSQMSQIGQLQSATSLQESLKTMVQQNQIGAAAGLIGKSIEGTDANNNPVKGMVTAVRVAGDAVNLELDNASTVSLDHVTTIVPTPAKAA